MGRRELSLSHVLYADDVLIFTNGSEKSLRNLMKLIKVCERSSGQRVNAAKSGYYIADKFHRRASIISRINGMNRGELPFNFLGVPTTNGLVKTIYFDHLIDKTRRAVHGWKAKSLTFGGRLTLIKSILESFPIYTLSNTLVPKIVLRYIESIMLNFLWEIRGTSPAHWISWRKICSPISEGGLGITNLS